MKKTSFYKYDELQQVANKEVIDRAVYKAWDKLGDMGDLYENNYYYDDLELLQDELEYIIDESELFEVGQEYKKMKDGSYKMVKKEVSWQHDGYRPWMKDEDLKNIRFKNDQDLEEILPSDLKEKYLDLIKFGENDEGDSCSGNYYTGSYYTNEWFDLRIDYYVYEGLKPKAELLKKYMPDKYKDYRFAFIHGYDIENVEEVNCEIAELLYDEMYAIRDEIEEYVNSAIEDLKDKLVDFLKKTEDYDTSEERVRDDLDCGNYFYDILWFDNNGDCYTEEEMEEILEEEEEEGDEVA